MARRQTPRGLRRIAALAAAALLAACGGGGGGSGGGGSDGGGGGGGALDPADIANWRTRDAKPLMSILTGTGTAWRIDPRLWQSSDRVVGVLPMSGVVRLGNTGREGLVFSAWGNSAVAEAAVPTMRFVILEQGADGLMRVATSRYVDDDRTDGVGDVVVADFNGDGRDDFAMPQYTETPTTASPPVPLPRSWAWISRPDGRYDRVDLSADANGPDLDAVKVGGQWQLFVPYAGYSIQSAAWEGAFTWRWNGSGFDKTVIGPTDPGSLTLASAVVVRDFFGDGNLWMVRSDTKTGPGMAAGAPMATWAWRIDGDTFATPPRALPTPYFNGKPAYDGYASWLDPDSKTHNARMWTTDLNQDGKLDLIAGAQIWDRTLLLQQAKLQLLINNGAGNFTDRTDALAPEFRVDGNIDYSPLFVDLDGSGIETLVMGEGRWLGVGSETLARSRHGSYILVNDGTGRLYAAMDAEFTALGQQVLDFVNAQDGLFEEARTQPSFRAYRRPDGKLNFVAQLTAMRKGIIDPGSQLFAFVNVPLGIDITTGFRRDLTVRTRNGSRNIRTFAGNDTIYRALADPDCRIDGGLGTNTVVYPGKRADWTVAKSGTTVTVTPKAGGGTDRLVHIQRARFDDETVDLTAL